MYIYAYAVDSRDDYAVNCVVRQETDLIFGTDIFGFWYLALPIPLEALYFVKHCIRGHASMIIKKIFTEEYEV